MAARRTPPSPPPKPRTPKAKKAPEDPVLEVKTGRVRAEIQPDNYQQKLPLDLGRAPDGSLLVDLRKGFSCLLVLPGDKVVRVSVMPEDTRPVDAVPSLPPRAPAPVVDPTDLLLSELDDL